MFWRGDGSDCDGCVDLMGGDSDGDRDVVLLILVVGVVVDVGR